jgi:hypothetical protein
MMLQPARSPARHAQTGRAAKSHAERMRLAAPTEKRMDSTGSLKGVPLLACSHLTWKLVTRQSEAACADRLAAAGAIDTGGC